MGAVSERVRAISSRAWGRSGLLPDVAAALILLLLVCLFNPGLALFGRVLGGYDAFVYFYPLRSSSSTHS